MAQKRMLNKSISLSAQVNKLNLKEKIIFTWSIPHLDDYGLLDSDPEVLKAMVIPMIKEITIKDINQFVKRAEELGLLISFQDCLEFTGFANHQSISEEKKAKMKFSKIPINPQENNGENNNPQKSPVQDKIREDKIREEKKKASLSYLKNIPLEDLEAHKKRFGLRAKDIQDKGESLFLYCQSKGKNYRNYAAFLLNALKRDFGEKMGEPIQIVGQYKFYTADEVDVAVKKGLIIWDKNKYIIAK